MIRFSAPAKVHVIGEHAVVHGKPAIISAINLRLYLTLQSSSPAIPAPNVVIPAPAKGGSAYGGKAGIHAIQSAVESTIKKTYKLKNIPLYQIEIKSEFPVGSGLGASAAISATLSAALLKLLKIKASKQEIYDIAISGERAIHGNPSGSDLAATIFGGTIWFRKETESIKLMTQVSIPQLTLFLIDTGKPKETTGEMVKKVAKLGTNLKKKVFDELELLAKNLLTDASEIKQIIKDTNTNLTRLGVVSKSTQKIIKDVEKSGGAAKITGAGGNKNGSGMIIVFHPEPKKLKGLNLIKIKINQEGLKFEK